MLSRLKMLTLKRSKVSLNPKFKTNIYNGVALAISVNLVNPYFAKFAERLGADAYQIASLNSLPAFFSLFALIPGAIFLDVFGNKQKNTTLLMLIHKFFYVLIALVPFITNISQPWLFVILIALMNLPGSIYTIGYQSSIGDIFTPTERGKAMSLRNKYSDLFRLLITFSSGIMLSIPKESADIIALYQFFFLISFLVGLVEVYTFTQFSDDSFVSFFKFNQKKDTSHHKNLIVVKETLKESLAFMMTNKNFKKFMFASLLFQFGWQMGWPLFNIYTITKLGANEAWLSAISIAGGLASILTATHWARFADLYGYTLTAFIATFGMSITPFLYVLSESLLMLVLFNILIGFSITGTVLVLFNLLLETTPTQNRTTIIAIYNTIVALSATITPLLAVWIMNATSLNASLIITGIFRFIGCFAFLIISGSLIKRNKNNQTLKP
ncbi:MFS transporter [Fusibacter bizertensis]